jgi:regulator of sigma E protease
MINQILMVALMIFGFGFVVFFHELGHFLAAKWVGIRVEQFAVGFGQALFAWRKGIGWKVGTTNKIYRERCIEWLTKNEKGTAPEEYTDDQINKTGDELGLGETEYRLNWIPLGGYVKMLGQDDLKANAGAEDPRAYNRKGIGQRMIVVSAGVIMNIILAAIGFTFIFLKGFDVAPPVIGHVITNSPAQIAGLHVGDRIMTIDGTRQYDFTRIMLSAALLKADTEVPVEIERPNATDPNGAPQKLTLHIRPAEMYGDIKGLLGIGVGPTPELRTAKRDTEESSDLDHLPDFDAIRPDETIVAIAGEPVKIKQYYRLFDALQRSEGKPVQVTVENADHQRRPVAITPWLDAMIWGNKPLEFAGMEPRPMVDVVPIGSSVEGKLKAGDVIVGIKPIDQENYPGRVQATEMFAKAAETKQKISLNIVRDGKELPAITDIVPHTKLENKKRGIGLALGYDSKPVVSRVSPDSPAGRAKVPAGTAISEIDGKPVDHWLQVRQLLATPVCLRVKASPPSSRWRSAHRMSTCSSGFRPHNTRRCRRCRSRAKPASRSRRLRGGLSRREISSCSSM